MDGAVRGSFVRGRLLAEHSVVVHSRTQPAEKGREKESDGGGSDSEMIIYCLAI